MMSTTSTSASAANKRYEGARPVPREKLQNLGVWCGLSAAENGLQNDGGGSVRQKSEITIQYQSIMKLYVGSSNLQCGPQRAIEPDNAAIKHSLGLLLVRLRNYAEALPQFREAAALAPDNARYAYVYSIALNSTGSAAEATM